MKELIFAIFKTGSGTFLTLIFGAITTKIIAYTAGASGLGLWSVVKEVQKSGLMMGSLNGNTSLVRGIGALNGEAKHQFIRTVMLIFFIGGLVVTLTLIFFATPISVLLKDIPAYIVMLMAIPVLFAIARSYVQGCLNGYRLIGRLAKTQIVGAAGGALIAYPVSVLAKNGSPSGLVLLSGVSAAVGLLAGLYYLKRINGFYLNLWKAPYWRLRAAKEFILIAGILSITGVVSVLSALGVKAIILKNGGLVDAGLFEASWGLSVMYVSILLSSFGTYVLPKLSSLDESGQVTLIQRVTKLTIIISIPVIVIVICIKPLVISIFFSQEFLPTIKMFRWMLIGDYFKISGWVFAMVLVANRYVGALVLSSVLWDLGLMLSVWLSYEFKLGLELIGFAIMALHALSLSFYYPYIRKKIGIKLSKRILITWFLGLIIIVFVSILTWEMIVVNWGHVCLLLLVSFGLVFFIIDGKDKLAIGFAYENLKSKL